MRFFQKRRAVINIEERGSESISQVNNNSNNNNNNYNGSKRGAFRKGPFPPFSDDEEYVDDMIEVEYPKNRQSIGELVRKLNCSSASEKYDEDFLNQAQYAVGDGTGGARFGNGYSPNNNQSSPWGSTSASPSRKNDVSSDITRPVLITVKDGDVDQPAPLRDNNNNNMSELKSSFVVGELPIQPVKMPSLSSFRIGMSARKRHHNATKDSNKNRSGWQNKNSPSRSSKGGLDTTTDNPQDVDPRRAAQETARRERWRRGLEMEKRMSKNTAATTTTTTASGYDNGDRDDHSRADSLTQGSHSTETSNTGYTGDYSSIGDWTDATDDSLGLTAPHHSYRRTSTTTTGHCTNRQQVVESVAEDFSILANLLLSDGYACFQTAAAITRETVAGCKGDER